MMGAFGSLAAMNEAIKKNRALLKAGKKRPFTKDRHYYAKRGEAVVIKSNAMRAEDRMQIIRQTWITRREQNRKLLVAILISLALVSVLVYYFLTWKISTL